jgi:hypothetical protein
MKNFRFYFVNIYLTGMYCSRGRIETSFLTFYFNYKGTLQFLTKSVLFRHATPYTKVGVYKDFGGTYCLHLQGRRVKKKKSMTSCFILTLKMQAVSSSRNTGKLLPEHTVSHAVIQYSSQLPLRVLQKLTLNFLNRMLNFSYCGENEEC